MDGCKERNTVHGRGTGTYTNTDATWGNEEVDGVCGDEIWDMGCGMWGEAE